MDKSWARGGGPRGSGFAGFPEARARRSRNSQTCLGTLLAGGRSDLRTARVTVRAIIEPVGRESGGVVPQEEELHGIWEGLFGRRLWLL